MPAVETQTLPARALAAGEGEARWWFGQLAVIKSTAESTGGGHTLVEITADRRGAGKARRHHLLRGPPRSAGLAQHDAGPGAGTVRRRPLGRARAERALTRFRADGFPWMRHR